MGEASNFTTMSVVALVYETKTSSFPRDGNWEWLWSCSISGWGSLPNTGSWYLHSLRHTAQGGSPALVCVVVHQLQPTLTTGWQELELSSVPNVSACDTEWKKDVEIQRQTGWILCISRKRLEFYAFSKHPGTHIQLYLFRLNCT